MDKGLAEWTRAWQDGLVDKGLDSRQGLVRLDETWTRAGQDGQGLAQGLGEVDKSLARCGQGLGKAVLVGGRSSQMVDHFSSCLVLKVQGILSAGGKFLLH